MNKTFGEYSTTDLFRFIFHSDEIDQLTETNKIHLLNFPYSIYKEYNPQSLLLATLFRIIEFRGQTQEMMREGVRLDDVIVQAFVYFPQKFKMSERWPIFPNSPKILNDIEQLGKSYKIINPRDIPDEAFETTEKENLSENTAEIISEIKDTFPEPPGKKSLREKLFEAIENSMDEIKDSNFWERIKAIRFELDDETITLTERGYQEGKKTWETILSEHSQEGSENGGINEKLLEELSSPGIITADSEQEQLNEDIIDIDIFLELPVFEDWERGSLPDPLTMYELSQILQIPSSSPMKTYNQSLKTLMDYLLNKDGEQFKSDILKLKEFIVLQVLFRNEVLSNSIIEDATVMAEGLDIQDLAEQAKRTVLDDTALM